MDHKTFIRSLVKYKLVLLIAAFCVLSSSLIVFALNSDNDSNSGRIEIVIENPILEYISEMSDKVYYAGVKQIFSDSGENILDPATVNWISKNENVAEVKENGAILPMAEGTTTIVAEYQGMQDSIEITVKKGFIDKLELSKSKVKLNHSLHKKGSQNPFSLIAIATTSSGKRYDVSSYSGIEWKSGDENTAEVTEGYIYTLKPGHVTITANFNGLTATSELDVEAPKVKTVKLKKNQVLIQDINGSEEVALNAEYDNGVVENVAKNATWESEDPNIAIVYDGIIQAVSEGKTKVKVKYEGYSETIVVKVKQAPEPPPSTVFP